MGSKELVAAVLADHTTAPITPRLRAIFTFVEKMNRASLKIGPDDVRAAEADGVTQEELYDAITVCALFNFYNKWIDATGVQDMTPELYEAGGKRLATQGYVMPPKTK